MVCFWDVVVPLIHELLVTSGVVDYKTTGSSVFKKTMFHTHTSLSSNHIYIYIYTYIFCIFIFVVFLCFLYLEWFS